jgi:heme/copper-type cytochrome/quinol oxidase subunit 3
MSKTLKVILGIATTVQPLVMIAMFAAFFSLFFYFVQDIRTPDDPALKKLELAILPINLLMIAYFGGLQLFYIVHAAKNRNIESMRVTWILGIVFLSIFVTPFYWYGQIWKDGVPRRSAGPLGLNSDD